MFMMDKYNTMTFVQVWNDSDVFKNEYLASPLATTNETIHHGETVGTGNNTVTYPDNVELLFALLYAKYGNSPIANGDVNQFKFKVFSIIFKYGPAWEKKLEIQAKIRTLTDDEIKLGSKAIHNHAFNDATAPSTDTLTELSYINDQNTTKYQKSPVEGYMSQWEALSIDITESFINKFKVCFKQFVSPEFGPRIMSNYDEED